MLRGARLVLMLAAASCGSSGTSSAPDAVAGPAGQDGGFPPDDGGSGAESGPPDGGGDAASAATWCAGNMADYTFCADFDKAGPYGETVGPGGAFESANAAGGSLAADGAQAVSPPSSLKAALVGGSQTSNLRASPGNAATLGLDFQLRVDTFQGTTSVDVLSITRDGQLDAVTFTLGQEKGQLTLRMAFLGKTPSSVRAPIATGTWIHVNAHLLWDTGQLDMSVGGAAPLTLAVSPASAKGIVLNLGASAVSNPNQTAATIYVDNFRAKIGN